MVQGHFHGKYSNNCINTDCLYKSRHFVLLCVNCQVMQGVERLLLAEGSQSIKCCVDQSKSYYKANLERIDLIVKITFTRLVKNFKIVLFSQNVFRYC